MTMNNRKEKLMAWALLSMAVLPVSAHTTAPVGNQWQTPVSQMEKLDRGVVALPAKDKGVFLSWRMLGTDSPTVCFDVERDGAVIASQLSVTNYTDPKGTSDSRYRIITYQQQPKMDAPAPREVSKTVQPWADLYRSLPLDRPQGGTAPDGRAYTYSPNDCSVGDVDGDGKAEMVCKTSAGSAPDPSSLSFQQ